MRRFEETFGYTPTFDTPDIYNVGYKPDLAERKMVRLGLIGTGGIAQSKHIPAIMRLISMWEPIELVAVAEPRQIVGEKIAQQYGVRWYEDYREMINKEQLDGVEVLTPDEVHTQPTIGCLRAGIHVLVEKPIATTLEDSRRMCETAEEEGVLLMTAFNKRFSPPYRKGKALIQEGVVSDPAMIIAQNCQGWSKSNLLEHQHCHLFDMMRCYGGEIVSLFAMGINKYGETSYPIDNVVAVMQFESGAIGAFYGNSCGLNLKPWERVEVRGKSTWFAVDGQYELFLYDSEEGPTKQWRPNMGNSLFFDAEFIGYVGEILHFTRAIRGEEPLTCTGWDGYKALEVAFAIHRSLERKEEVSLPL